MSEFHVVNSKHSLDCFIDDCRRRFEQDHYHEYRWSTKEKARTLTQNNCIHRYCTDLARAFNAAGYDRVIDSPILKEPIELPWDQTAVKETLWRKVQFALTGHESTTDISTKECSLIYETIHRHLASSRGIEVEWPHRERE